MLLRLLPVGAICFLFAHSLLAESRLTFPRVVFQQGRQFRISVSNPTAETARITLKAYNDDGTLFGAPREATIPPGRQYSQLATEIFDPPPGIAQGSTPTRVWVEVGSSTDALTGSFLDGNTGLDFLDGSNLVGSGTQLVLPLIDQSGANTTEISLVNPNTDAANVAIDFLRSNGTSVAAQALVLPALGALQGPVATLFSFSFNEVVALRTRSDRGLVCFAYVSRPADNSLVTVAAQDYTLPAKTLYFPQLAEGDLWSTHLGLINFSASEVLVTITAYRPEGQLFNAPVVANNPVSTTILAGGVLRAALRSLFGFQAKPLQVGWIKVEANIAALGGYVEYGTGRNRALVPAQLEAYTRATFLQPPLSSRSFTGLAILNSGSLAANVEIVSLGPEGAVIGKSQRVLKERQREALLIEQWIPSASVVGSTIFVKSDIPTVATQVFGADSLSALVNVPPQKVTTLFDPGASLPRLSVSPLLAVVETGKQWKFDSQGAAGLSWKVNDVPGGSDSLGTITGAGLFKAPRTAPRPPTVAVQAFNTSDNQSAGAAVHIAERSTVIGGLTQVTAVAYLENLQRFFIAEQQLLSSVVTPGAPLRAVGEDAFISEQTPSGAVSKFFELRSDAIGKMLPFVDANDESYLLIAGTNSGRVYRLRLSDKQLTTVESGLNRPTSMAFDVISNKLLVAEQGSNRIVVIARSKFDPTASAAIRRPDGTDFEPSTRRGKIISVAAPRGVAVDRCSGAVYVSSSDGAVRQYLSNRVVTLASGLSDPDEILVLYRGGTTSCSDGVTLLVSEPNRIVQIFPETNRVLTFLEETGNTRDLVFFPSGSPFIRGGEASVAFASAPTGAGASTITEVGVEGLYENVAPLPPRPIDEGGAAVPFRDALADTFATALSSQNGLETPDIVSVDAYRLAGAVVLVVVFDRPVAGASANVSNSVFGFIDFDFRPGGSSSRVDPHNSFGLSSGLGVDAYVDLSRGELIEVGSSRTFAVTMNFLAATLTVRIPLSTIDLSRSLMAVAAGNRVELTDIAPNDRFIALRLDEARRFDVGFAHARSSGAESVPAVTLDVVLSSGAPAQVVVDYAVSGGSATAGGVDYQLAAGKVTFAPGETIKKILLAIVDDSIAETDETVRVTLSNPVNASLGARSEHVYTILDNDQPPAVSFRTTASQAAEASASAAIDVVLSKASPVSVTVSYGVSGGTATGGGADYALASGILTFAPGETFKTIGVTITNDALDESDETVIVTLSGPAQAVLGANTAHSLTIVDDDPLPVISFAGASSSGNEATISVSLPVTLSGPSFLPVEVNYVASAGTAASNVDYTLAAGTLTWSPGETSQSIRLRVIDDSLSEPDETVVVTLSSPNGATLGTATHTYTILDNDRTAVTASWTSRGAGGGAFQFSPSLSPHNPDEIYLAGHLGALFRTSDQGVSWTTIDFRQVKANLFSKVRFTNNPAILYVLDARSGGQPAKSSDGGQTWNVLSSAPATGPIYGVFVDSNNPNVVVISDFTGIFVSLDGGTTFAQKFSTADTNRGIHVGGAFFEGSSIYLGTSKGLLVSVDGGNSFTVATAAGIPADEAIYSFAGAKQSGTVRFFAVTLDANVVAAGADLGGQYTSFKGLYSLDWGQPAWVAKRNGIASDEFPNLVAMAGDDIATAYVGGGNDSSRPILYKTGDGGSNWQRVLLTANNQNVTTGWAGDGGARGWSYGESVVGLAVSPTNVNRVVFGDWGFAYVSIDGGSNWRQMYVDPRDQNPANGPAQRAKSYRSIGLENSRAWWVAWSDASTLFAGYSDIRAVRSIDAGSSWSFNYSGYSGGTTYQVLKHTPSGNLYAAVGSVHDIYQAAYLTDSIDSGSGRILFSSDGGANWQLLRDFVGPVVFLAFDPNNGNRAYASVADSVAGGIFVTSDLQNGPSSTWTKLANPPRTEGHPFNIDVLADGTLVCTYSGRLAGTPAQLTASSGVFVSIDGGATWLDRSDAGMLFWTKDLIIDPGDATQSTWYVGVVSGASGPSIGAGGLYRTTDRGRTWTRIFAGDSVESCAVSPTNPNEMYLASEQKGLWYCNNLQAASPSFSEVLSYPFGHPSRIFYNPFDPGEIWVTSVGNGMRVRRSK